VKMRVGENKGEEFDRAECALVTLELYHIRVA
jgi:hypothetical protein